jgi:two-component system LytT family response regulator
MLPSTERLRDAMPIRALIADDEPLARERLRRLLDEDPDVALVGEAGDGEEALRVITDRAPELVFLDVQMTGLDGFALLEAIPLHRQPVVVFVTASPTHAPRAFEAQAIDYVLKPFDDARFRLALRRAKHHIGRFQRRTVDRRLEAVLETLEYPRVPRRLIVHTQGRVILLRAQDVDWFEADGNYVRAHLRGETHLVRRSLGGLERELGPEHFFRVHRSLLVNLTRIAGLEQGKHGAAVIVFHDGTRLRTSRSRGAKLQRRLSCR